MNLLKTFWEKEKMLFQHFLLFPQCVLPIEKLLLSFNYFPNKALFNVSAVQVVKTLWQKEKLLVMRNFSSHSVFYHCGEFSAIFIKFETVLCKTLLIWKSLKFVVCERVKLNLMCY